MTAGSRERVIDGRTFRLEVVKRRKIEAKRIAVHYSSLGHLARVIESSDGWEVWVSRGRRKPGKR